MDNPTSPLPQPTSKGARKRLLRVFDALPAEARSSLLDFAEFLVAKHPAQRETSLTVVDIPRPQDESVIAAIRRLVRSYPMLDRDSLFSAASSLMTQHLVHGQEAAATIDQIEALFRSRYQALRAESDEV